MQVVDINLRFICGWFGRRSRPNQPQILLIPYHVK